MSVNNVTQGEGVGSTESTTPAYIQNAKTELENFSVLFEDLQTNNNDVKKLNKTLLEAFQKELEELKNLIDTEADEEIIEAAIAALMAKLSGNPATGALGLADRAKLLADLQAEVNGQAGSGEIENHFNAISNILNSNVLITNGQANAFKDLIKASITLTAATNLNPNFATLASSYNSQITALLSKDFSNQDVQNELAALLSNINGDGETASIVQRVERFKEVQQIYNNSQNKQDIEESYNKTIQQLCSSDPLSIEALNLGKTLLTQLDSGYNQYHNSVATRTHLKTSLASKVLQESTRYLELKQENENYAKLQKSSDQNLKNLYENDGLLNVDNSKILQKQQEVLAAKAKEAARTQANRIQN